MEGQKKLTRARNECNKKKVYYTYAIYLCVKSLKKKLIIFSQISVT